MTQLERLEANEVEVEGMILIDEEGIEEALIGVTDSEKPCAVYDYEKLVEVYVNKHGLSYEEAAEHVCFNIMRSLPYYGENAPIIVDLFKE